MYFERANIGINVFKEELCKGYGNKSDESCIFKHILFDIMKYSKRKRHKFYDILLHKFINLESLNSLEMITILKRTVYKIDKRVDLQQFELIAKKQSLNGQSMVAIQNSEQFANMFDALQCDSSVLENIYKAEMKKWQQTPTEYEHSSSRIFGNLFGLNLKPKTPSKTKSKIIKMFSPKTCNNKKQQTKQKNEAKQNRPKHAKYLEVTNEEQDDTENEIADALIDIIEEVVRSGPYTPSKTRRISRSQSKRKEHKSSKRRRPSNKSNVFPRKRRRKMTSHSLTTTTMSDVSILNVLEGDLSNLDIYLEYVIDAGQKKFEQEQLLSFIIDTFDLIRCGKIATNECEEYTMSEFIETHSAFKKIEDYILQKNGLKESYKNTGDLMTKIIQTC